jgi:iron(III) transport system ATP-binding protein
LIKIKGLRKRYMARHGAVEALRGIDLEIAEREFCVLLGPSGCGKTTTLRCVAGLERPEAGEIEIGGTLVNSPSAGVYVATEKRDIGMVFQSYAIWPHMNVFQNVAFPLTQGQKRFSRQQVTEKVRQALNLVQLNSLETRPATDLSGGQQQRVAMARAMVTEPRVLLMDEPLSNLDARLREQMRIELKKIAKSIGVTTLYVTHDQAEALSLGDRVCVMNEGEILQVGPPREVYSSPPNLFVARFVGEMNFVEGKVAGPGQVDTRLGAIGCSVPPEYQPGSAVTLAIRPENLALQPGVAENSGSVEGTIAIKTYLGDAVLFEVEVNGVTLIIKVPGDLDLAVGQRAGVLLPTDRWHVYSDR